MPLIELKPPTVRPCLVAIGRPAVPADGYVLNCQLYSELYSIFVNPAGT